MLLSASSASSASKPFNVKECRENLILSVIILLIYASNRFLGVFDGIIPGDLARNHLGDLCGGFLIVCYVNLILNVSKYDFRFTSWGSIFLFELLCSFWWEVLAPMALSYSTGDFWDAVAYLLGGTLYCASIKAIRKCKQQRIHSKIRLG